MKMQSFVVPKRGNTHEECEDARAGDEEKGCFAVADGASESAFSGAWARCLVEGFCEDPTNRPSQWGKWLPPVQQRWLREVTRKPLRWYLELKVQQGAFATFLGLRLFPRKNHSDFYWRAVAVGDTCLFHLRADDLRRTFPVKAASAFSNQPWLVGSRNQVRELHEQKRFCLDRGLCERGDEFWLMTDALAHWFLAAIEDKTSPWDQVREHLTDDATFTAWIELLRSDKRLRNDDVTLLAVQV